jgi:hypothetical protein
VQLAMTATTQNNTPSNLIPNLLDTNTTRQHIGYMVVFAINMMKIKTALIKFATSQTPFASLVLINRAPDFCTSNFGSFLPISFSRI